MSEGGEMKIFRAILKGKEGRFIFHNGMVATGEFKIEITRTIDKGICGI